ncbi:hypothetical protein KJ612_02120 [Myxococcota bacterium]|nr:hypothetical protein [Myxococcota bacterium]PKN22621.1 MAG: hypothetical protein CVU65_14965 [Deltaproteobacteria bacterium HGW-Deltaproteobacteria-22]
MFLSLFRRLTPLAVVACALGLATATCDDPDPKTPCDGVTCHGPGTCSWTADGSVYCACAPNSHSFPDDPLTCVIDDVNDVNHEETAGPAR